MTQGHTQTAGRQAMGADGDFNGIALGHLQTGEEVAGPAVNGAVGGADADGSVHDGVEAGKSLRIDRLRRKQQKQNGGGGNGAGEFCRRTSHV
ncbi:MAG: hypothetical protein OXU34_06400 [Gammaproteobacteria bacterium]|nr:hypothetical protein [Gammaproteobacteria bacterium]